MKISVIIPTYKPKDYLWECLESLIKQTFNKDDFEIILVLNGCCEPWKQKIENYISKNMHDMNICFFQTDAPGVSNARNIALDNAKGEYITFIDDDDYISSVYLQALYDKATPETVSLCYPYAFNDECPNVQLPYRITDAYNNCTKKNIKTLTSVARKFFSGPCMKLIPSNIIRNYRFDIRFKNGEDSLFMFSISDKIKKIDFTSKEAVYYRRYRTNSATSNLSSLNQKMKHVIKMIYGYCEIYSKGKYNKIFFITRILAAFKV